MTPGQGRADEQIHSRVQRCGEHSSELVGQTQGTAGVDVRRKCDNGSLICKIRQGMLTNKATIDLLIFDFQD